MRARKANAAWGPAHRIAAHKPRVDGGRVVPDNFVKEQTEHPANGSFSRRSKPSSRTALTGEQPDPWNLLQLQDAMSRHRGAKPERRCELLAQISLLSPAYLLSVERRPFHAEPPDH